jgi:hypothetical protein
LDAAGLNDRYCIELDAKYASVRIEQDAVADELDLFSFVAGSRDEPSTAQGDPAGKCPARADNRPSEMRPR